MSDGEWTLVGGIRVNGRLSISDTSYFYDEPVIVSVRATTHMISVEKTDFSGHQHVMAIRAVSSGGAFIRGRALGEVTVDFGSTTDSNRPHRVDNTAWRSENGDDSAGLW